MADVSAISYPPKLEESERELRAGRRAQWSAQPDNSVDAACGLAISGGGIRSATFALGFLQAMAGRGLFRYLDYLSTVSGGSYIGGFLGALFHRAEDPRQAEATLADRRSPVVNWLRENGRYLSPGGASDGWAALSVVLRGVVAVNIVMWVMTLTIFLVLDALRGVFIHPGDPEWVKHVEDRLSAGPIWWSPGLFVPVVVFALGLLPLGLAYWRVPGGEDEVPRSPIQSPGMGARLWARAGRILRRGRGRPSFFENIVAYAVVAVVYARLRRGSVWDAQTLVLAVLIIGTDVLARLWSGAASIAAAVKRDGKNLSETKHAVKRARVTRWLRAVVIIFVLALVVGAIDSLGQSLYRTARATPDVRRQIMAAIVPGIVALFAVASGVQKAVGALGAKKSKTSVPINALALVGAIVLGVPILTGLSAIAHGMAWRWADPSVPSAIAACPSPVGTCKVDESGVVHVSPDNRTPRPLAHDPPLSPYLVLLIVAGVVLCRLYGRTYSFLNGSSLASLYAARLNRAYVGASNPERLNARSPSTELLPGDPIAMSVYAPHAKGGPLHIINATLNETLGGRSQVEERDRKGMNLAFGPAGVSVAMSHHATWTGTSDRRSSLTSADVLDDTFHVFPKSTDGKPLLFQPELLDLGRWIAVSGAAASTALGSLTSPWLSFLCGTLNVRLGHWWWSGVDPLKRTMQAQPGPLRVLGRLASRVFPVQAHLLNEFTARFPGTASRNWYLTDGGHFENTGAYELIRRRLPWIIVLDDGADPDFKLEDVANLVRKSRVDFDAHITFLDAEDSVQGSLKRAGTCPMPFEIGQIGGLRELAKTKHVALAEVKYAGEQEPSGRLLLVRPSLVGGEPLDVVQYSKLNDFPQQTTADQFFDEAQWESYRRLGDHIGTRLFGE